MNKTTLIIKREYLTRVRKKSFIIMTLLAPILMALMFIIPIWVANMKDTDEKRIAVIDKSGSFKNVISDTKILKFEFINEKEVSEPQEYAKANNYYAILTITDSVAQNNITLHSFKQPGLEIKSYIEKSLEREIENRKLETLGINRKDLEKTKTNVDLEIFKWKKTGEEEKSYTELAMAIGFIMAFLIYMMVFIYGAQVMRGVIEEKTSRVVEIIVSSVKPFQLMLGKIIGIALVALTQFTVWIVLTAIIVSITSQVLQPEQISENQLNNQAQQEQFEQMGGNETITEIFNAISTLNIPLLLGTFLFFFIGGYLLYSSLFAAVGGAVDNETDTQQFMLPISIPLILAFIVAQAIIQNPEGPIAVWFSIIPFTSPIIMMIRVAFGVPEAVPYWQLILSMVLLIATFIGTTWLAAKIYRVGILMYGKKVSYKELWKWIRYKN